MVHELPEEQTTGDLVLGPCRIDAEEVRQLLPPRVLEADPREPRLQEGVRPKVRTTSLRPCGYSAGPLGRQWPRHGVVLAEDRGKEAADVAAVWEEARAAAELVCLRTSPTEHLRPQHARSLTPQFLGDVLPTCVEGPKAWWSRHHPLGQSLCHRKVANIPASSRRVHQGHGLDAVALPPTLQRCRHHSLVLQRVQGASGVDKDPTGRQQEEGAHEDVALEAEEAQGLLAVPRAPHLRVLPRRPVAAARHVRQYPRKLHARTSHGTIAANFLEHREVLGVCEHRARRRGLRLCEDAIECQAAALGICITGEHSTSRCNARRRGLALQGLDHLRRLAARGCT
mmetsp:Transcript_114002/g.303016  ORF Transcript_114002/g.303016 Transcript_114002/m.303016 type:complete len:341 (-) Transcript_114002:583-1605(-)